jgi:hypothetical protein
MFTWLRKLVTGLDISNCATGSNGQIADGLETLGKLKQLITEIDSKAEQQAAAARIVRAFAEALENSTEQFPDARKLPYEKSVIREALATRIQFYRDCCKQEPTNPTWQKDLELHKVLRLHISDFCEIDAADKTAVQEANAGRLDDRKKLILILKYRQRGTKEEGKTVENPLERDGEKVTFDELCRRFGAS